MSIIREKWFSVSASKEEVRNAAPWAKQHSGTMIGVGIAMVVLGIMALINTIAATLVSVLVLAAYLAVGGILHIIDAFIVRRWNLALLDVLAGVVYLIGAWLIWQQPIAAASVITVILAALFMVGGAVRFIVALAMQPANWGWLLTHGLITFLLGLVLFAGMPFTGLTGPGLLVGVDLVFSGSAMLAFGITARRWQRQRMDQQQEGKEEKESRSIHVA